MLPQKIRIFKELKANAIYNIRFLDETKILQTGEGGFVNSQNEYAGTILCSKNSLLKEPIANFMDNASE